MNPGELSSAGNVRARIAIITVQYGNPADTEKFVESMMRLEDASDCELIIVDNAPDPAKVATFPSSLRDAAFTVRTLQAPRNLYYWGGANFALEQLEMSANPGIDWVVICNNDIEFKDGHFLRTLRSLDPDEHAIVAPRILSGTTGRDQNPLLRERPAMRTRLKWRLYDSGYLLAKAALSVQAAWRSVRPQALRAGLDVQSENRTVYAPHGSFVILSSEFFRRGGSLDLEVPLFAEELTLAVAAEKLGLSIWHVPSLQVIHWEHRTTGPALTRAKYRLEKLARRRYREIGG